MSCQLYRSRHEDIVRVHYHTVWLSRRIVRYLNSHLVRFVSIATTTATTTTTTATNAVGKTFTGDYLEHVHNFVHVDGDMQLRNIHIPQYRANFKGLMGAMKNKDDTDDPAWQPYIQELVDQTLEAAKTSEKVVLTFACFQQKHRDFVMTQLTAGGATQTRMVFLTINEDVKFEGLYHRTKRQLQGTGMDFGDWMRSVGWEGTGEPTIKDVKILFKAFNEKEEWGKFEGPPSDAIVVDVTGRDVTALDATDLGLGLTKRNPEVDSYDSIFTTLLERDRKRDAETPYDHEELGAIDKELLKEKTEAEREQIQQRRSSLRSVERQFGLTRLSASSSTSTSSTSNNGNGNGDAKAKACRQSLILTGKIEFE